MLLKKAININMTSKWANQLSNQCFNFFPRLFKTNKSKKIENKKVNYKETS